MDNTDDNLSAPHSTSLTLSGNLTISAWGYRTSATTNDTIVDYSAAGETEDTNRLYKFYLDSANKLNLEWENGAGVNIVVTSSVAVSNPVGNWKHYAVTRDNTAKQVKFYVNGSRLGAVQTYTVSPSGGTLSTLSLGKDNENNSDFFDGKLDEVRISSSVKSPSLLKTEFNNQNSPATFYSVTGLVD